MPKIADKKIADSIFQKAIAQLCMDNGGTLTVNMTEIGRPIILNARARGLQLFFSVEGAKAPKKAN